MRPQGSVVGGDRHIAGVEHDLLAAGQTPVSRHDLVALAGQVVEHRVGQGLGRVFGKEGLRLGDLRSQGCRDDRRVEAPGRALLGQGALVVGEEQAAAGLIGRSVTAAGLPAILSGGQPVNGTVSLPNGASAVQLDIFDASGKPVRSMVAGSQQAGTPAFTWDGLDNSGNTLADGAYKVTATVTVAGAKGTAPVNMSSTVQSVSSDASTKDLVIRVQGGQSIPLASVLSFGG